MVWPALIAAAGSLGGAMLATRSAAKTNVANSAVNRAQMEFNAAEAEKARQFSAHSADKAFARSTDLANTAHTRQVADLRRAGLNPILSARYGGAPTPPVASPQGTAASAGSLKAMVNEGGAGVAAALDIARTASQAMLAQAQATQAKAAAKNLGAQTNLANIDSKSRHLLNLSEVGRRRMDAFLKRQQGVIAKVYTPAQIDAAIAKMKSESALALDKSAWQKVSTSILRQELKRAVAFGKVWTGDYSQALAYLQEGAKGGLSLSQMVTALSRVAPTRLITNLLNKLPGGR